MDHKNAAELTAELNADPSFVEVTIGLDNGRLIKSATHSYFIARRLGGWEVVEQSLLSNVSRVEKKSNFMGETFIIHTTSGRWICKDVSENIDLRTWILQKAQGPHGSSTRPSGNIVNQTTDSSVAREASRQPEWESSITYASRPETDSAKFFSTFEKSLDESLDGFNDSDMSNAVGEALPEELESIFNSMTEEPTQSVQKPSARIQEVDNLLEKMASSNEDTNESGCGGSFVKLFIFLWIFGIFADFCN